MTKDGKKIVGIVGQNVPAYMAPSDLKELEPTDIARKLTPEGLKSWADIATRMAKEHKAPWELKSTPSLPPSSWRRKTLPLRCYTPTVLKRR